MTGRKFRVFVVEDHAATARGLKVFLELAGYEVEVAGDKKSALKLAEQMRFDVLVCDVSLPDGTGWELMETLRKTNPMRGIVFSAFDEPEHIARSKAAGFDEHVVKGTTPETLLAAIDRIAKFQVPVGVDANTGVGIAEGLTSDGQSAAVPIAGRRAPASKVKLSAPRKTRG